MSNLLTIHDINKKKYNDCLIELCKNEDTDKYKNCINIDNENIFTYLYNSPSTYIEIVETKISSKNDNNEMLYIIIPRYADILLDIKISGEFTLAELYQYTWTGSVKEIFSTLNSEGIMEPFPYSGIPLLQLGTHIYLSIISNNKTSIKVEAKLAFLEHFQRRKISEATLDNINGLKIQHKNNKFYQIVNINDMGHSPNKLVKLD